jgi:prepilin-type N-terminal cleavage/methylation domain-containing protein
MKMHRRNTQAAQKGVTLIELLLGIAIVLVIVGVGVIVYNQVSGSSRAYAASNGVMNLAASVKALHPRPDYTGLTSAVMVSSGKAPSNMVVGTNLVGQFGGNVVIAPANYAGGANNAFTIVYPGIPRAECNDMIQSSESTFAIIEVGTSSGGTFTGTTTVKDLSATPAVRTTAATVSAACNNENNAVRFTSA